MVQKLPTPEGQDKITSSHCLQLFTRFYGAYLKLTIVTQSQDSTEREKEAGAEMVAADSLT